MRIEKVFDGIRYTLTNEGLQVGDMAYPIARGRRLAGGGWILHDFSFENHSTGFPHEPHTIVNIHAETIRKSIKKICGSKFRPPKVISGTNSVTILFSLYGRTKEISSNKKSKPTENGYIEWSYSHKPRTSGNQAHC